jgi:hypothetical protein
LFSVLDFCLVRSDNAAMDPFNPYTELAALAEEAQRVPFWKVLTSLALFVIGIIAGTWCLAALLLSLEAPGVWL